MGETVLKLAARFAARGQPLSTLDVTAAVRVIAKMTEMVGESSISASAGMTPWISIGSSSRVPARPNSTGRAPNMMYRTPTVTPKRLRTTSATVSSCVFHSRRA